MKMASLILYNGLQAAKQQTGVLGVLCVKSHNYSTDAPRPLKTTKISSMKRGAGGRSSYNGIVATIFGCTGFMGRYVVNRLGKTGTQMILPYRADYYEALRLKVAGDLGQILFHPYHLEDEESIRKAVKYSDVVINLVGRDWETKNFKFGDVHVDGARRLARICKHAGVEKFIHFSALNATPNPPPIMKKGSGFLKSKYYGELAVREEFPEAIIFRPSDIYGSEDRFLRMYAHVWRRTFRAMPLWHGGEKTEKQPVHCADVAQAVINAIKDPDALGKTYQAVGPRRYKLSTLVDWFHAVMRKNPDNWEYSRYDSRYDPTFAAKIEFTEWISPGDPLGHLHWERVEREFVSDTVEKGVPTLEDLGVNLTFMEDQIHWELRPYRAAQYYAAELGEFEKAANPEYIQ